MTLVAIGTSSFGQADPRPLDVLRAAGLELRLNTRGRTLSEQEAIDHVADADGWIAGAEPVSRRVLSAARHLRAVARVGVGLDTVDLDAARELGIVVSRTPDAPTDAVAEMTLAGLLAITRRLLASHRDVSSGRWTRHLGMGLAGARVLVVGYGRIGRRTAELLRAFGAEILVADPHVAPSTLRAHERLVGLDEGLPLADVVTLHATGGTTLIDRAALDRMKPGVILLNSARGDLIDEAALEDALSSGHVGGCWLDVFRQEPYDGPLARSARAIVTPHAATFTRECRVRMEVEAAENLLRDLAASVGRP